MAKEKKVFTPMKKNELLALYTAISESRQLAQKAIAETNYEYVKKDFEAHIRLLESASKKMDGWIKAGQAPMWDETWKVTVI